MGLSFLGFRSNTFSFISLLVFTLLLSACSGGDGSGGTQDATPPVITLLGADPTDLLEGDTYTDPGATASDNVDGDITSNIVVAGDTVNTANVGIYVVTYDVNDAAGNSATQITRTVNVIDNTAPIITLLGADPLNLVVGNTYTDPGATASDNVDGDITSSIAVGGDTVNTALAGTYVVTYDVSDVAGNPATQLTRTVIVVNVAPAINSFSVSPNPAYTNSAATFSWAVSDANGDTLTCLLDVNDDGTDDYTINDCANNTSQDHLFSVAGDYTARLTVSDSIATPVEGTLNLTTVSPLSTDVTVNGHAVAGDRLLYTITVSNLSPIPLNSVGVSLIVPAELMINNIVDADPNAVCPGTTCTPTETASWALGTLAAGESRTITVNPLVDVALLDGVVITVPVTFSATGISDIQINKTAEIYSTPSADLALSASTDPVVPNEAFTYNLDFGNVSAGALTTLQLTANLPAGVTVSSISDSGTEVSPGVVVWDVASLGVGASLHREITVTAGGGLVAGQILKASAQLTHDGSLAVDNTTEHAVTVVSSAVALNVDISTSVNPVVAGERVLYTLTVSNTSLLPVDAVNVLLRMPAELMINNIVDADPNAVCSGTTCTPTEEASWALGTLAAGESRTIMINPLVDVGFLSGNLITVPVRVTATDLGDDINLLKTIAIYSTPSADLALSASTDPVVPNEAFTYNLDFGNVSAGALTTLQLTANLPAGVTVSSISDSGTEVSPGVVVWDVASLGVGASLHREITVTAGGTVAGDILKLHAELTHDGGVEQDNTAEFAVSVAGSISPLSVVIMATPDPVASAGVLAYTITVTNDSSLPVDAVDVMFRVPAELSFVIATDTNPNAVCPGTICNPTEEASWALGTLAANGGSQVITINATVATGLDSGNLISMPVRVTATQLEDTINLQHTTVIDNP